jgi:biotin transport system substrate-specific component
MRPDAATLRLAVLPRAGILADLVLVLAGAALVALAAQVRIPLDPVPITGQTFAVLLVGASLGSVRGFASVALYSLAGIAGAPVFQEQNHGWEYFTGATGGYIVGFAAAAAVTGWLAERRWDRRFASAVAAMLTGNVIVYLFGLPWLAHVADYDLLTTLQRGLAPFLPGDLVKLYLAAALLPGAWRIVERLER